MAAGMRKPGMHTQILEIHIEHAVTADIYNQHAQKIEIS